MPVRPTCLALVLCDAVVHRPDTGKSDVVGAFWSVQMQSFPGLTDPFTLWVVLTNGAGRVTMRLRIEYLPQDRLEEEPIVDIRFTMEFPDPRVVRMYVGRIDGLALGSPGLYRMTLTAHDATLVQGPFVARQIEP